MLAVATGKRGKQRLLTQSLTHNFLTAYLSINSDAYMHLHTHSHIHMIIRISHIYSVSRAVHPADISLLKSVSVWPAWEKNEKASTFFFFGRTGKKSPAEYFISTLGSWLLHNDRDSFLMWPPLRLGSASSAGFWQKNPLLPVFLHLTCRTRSTRWLIHSFTYSRRQRGREIYGHNKPSVELNYRDHQVNECQCNVFFFTPFFLGFLRCAVTNGSSSVGHKGRKASLDRWWNGEKGPLRSVIKENAPYKGCNFRHLGHH